MAFGLGLLTLIAAIFSAVLGAGEIAAEQLLGWNFRGVTFAIPALVIGLIAGGTVLLKRDQNAARRNADDEDATVEVEPVGTPEVDPLTTKTATDPAEKVMDQLTDEERGDIDESYDPYDQGGEEVEDDTETGGVPEEGERESVTEDSGIEAVGKVPIPPLTPETATDPAARVMDQLTDEERDNIDESYDPYNQDGEDVDDGEVGDQRDDLDDAVASTSGEPVDDASGTEEIAADAEHDTNVNEGEDASDEEPATA